jgi:4-amino-4-deoxy-L-arabinose transferase-like glycosyltransferase
MLQDTVIATRSKQETAVAVGLAIALALVQMIHLAALIVADQDEGTYVYAGRLIAEGLVPYRDFMFAHPPVLPAFVAAIWKFAPDILSVRVVFLLCISALGLCTFGMVRRITASAAAGMAAMALQTLGMLCIANMGRTVRLEPLLAALFMAGAWSLLRGRSRGWILLSGALFALSLLVKFTAVVVVVPFAAAFLWYETKTAGERLRTLGWLSLGGAVVMLPVLAWLLSEPEFVQWGLSAQSTRPRVELLWRFLEFARSCLRFPLLPLALIAAVRMLRSDARPGERPLAVAGIASMLLLMFGFKSYYKYYIVGVLPVLTACLAIEGHRLFKRRFAPGQPRWAAAAICATAVFASYIFVEVYNRAARDHTSSPARIVAQLREVPGPVYTLVPDFALWSGQRMPDWYYVVDSYLPRIVGFLGDADFERLMGRSNAAVLSPGEFSQYPRTTALLAKDFRRTYADAYWELWVRGPNPTITSTR